MERERERNVCAAKQLTADADAARPSPISTIAQPQCCSAAVDANELPRICGIQTLTQRVRKENERSPSSASYSCPLATRPPPSFASSTVMHGVKALYGGGASTIRAEAAARAPFFQTGGKIKNGHNAKKFRCGLLLL